MTPHKPVKKKVLVVIRWPVGGIRTYIRYVYRNFDPNVWHLTILAPNLSEMQTLLDDLSYMDICYIPVETNPGFISFSMKVSRELLKFKYDLVHSQGFTSGMCSVLPAKFMRIKHLMTSHDVINKNQFTGLNGWIKKQIIEKLFSMIDIIQSVSYDAQTNLHDNFTSLARIQGKSIVITNGIEVDRFMNASPRDFRKELNLGNEYFLIGFLGRFMSQKGFRYLVDAIDILSKDSQLPKKPLVLTFGEGGFIREEKQAIKDRSLEVFFHFMPFTPNVAATLKGLDVVAMPSLWEACPLQPMEALVSGTPFLGTDCIGLREVLVGTPARVVAKGNASALAISLRKEMETNSKKEFVAYSKVASLKFDVSKSSKQLLEVYNDILK